MQSKAQAICAVFRQHNPLPQTELQYTNHFTLLIAVILSARTTDAQVNVCTPRLFQRASTPEQMVRLTLDELLTYVNTIGLFRQKAKHILATSHMLITHHNGCVPATREALEALPGVGRKTANVVLNVAFGLPTMPVDTHVFRLAHRLGLSQGRYERDVERDLLQAFSQEDLQYAHHWLILHGRYVCKARQPKCAECVLAFLCPSCSV